jgi:acetoin utilization deacetylase AcuC-like enzyme/GNAT superfamily N-acetyltransferase
MLRIRKVADATTAVNRAAIEAAQKIMREQFSAMPDADIAKLPEQLANPLKHKFVSRLFVAETTRDQTLGVALLLHAPDLDFCYLEIISAAAGRTGRGIGATLYERVREEAGALGAQGLYFESLPDDPELSLNPEIRAGNAARLSFYERYGARPIANTAYETPIRPGTTDPPYLVLDPLGSKTLPGSERVRKVVRAILERKYGAPPDYIRMVLDSIKDDPIRLREKRYTRATAAQKGVVRAGSEPRIALVLNDDHTIHHVQDRGYVEAPVRIRSILSELDASGLFEKIPAKRYSERHIRAVHDGRLVDYIRKACLMAGPRKSIYPYVFPTRNPARPPKDETVLAGYYCIDTFTPLNQNAYLAARSAVDCALTAAERVLGSDLAYALVRPPGHHAETRNFGGFCYFNNGAIAANLLSRYGKVAVLDIDYHHGNGQQEIFYTRADVLTVSIHGHPSIAYPYFTGFRDETGTGAGAGFNLNIPLPEHITPEQHRNAVAEGLRRIRRFGPAFLVVCAGFDTARGDPTGTWPNRARDFEQLGRMIGEQGYSTLVVQEGGYRVRTLGANVRSFFNGLVTGQSSSRQMAPVLMHGDGKAKPGSRDGLEWRSAAMADDVGRVRSLVASTGFFNAAEVEVAADLVTERLTKGIRSGYYFVLAERGSALVAYACYGPVAGTQGSFELYWIAVAPEEQRRGLGAQAYVRAEAAMGKAGARQIYADTSTSDRYAPTRGFYQRMGFVEQARLADFYAAGDGKIVYVKELGVELELRRHPGESRDPEPKAPS